MDWKSKTENIVTTFFETKKNSNNLLELEELLLSSNEECVLSTLEAVSALFSEIFSRGLLTVSSSDKTREYILWLLNRYEDFVSHLISYLSHENKEIQSSALKVLMSFVKLESKYPCRARLKDQAFPFTIFQKIASSFLSDILDMSELIQNFEEYSCYEDVKLYTLKAVHVFLNELDQVSDLCLQNCFSLLCSVKFPQDFALSSSNIFTESKTFELKEKPFRKIFSSAWGCILDRNLPLDLLKKILVVLNDSILPYLQNPCYLADFLINAYNSGGVLSLLALKGLFILMNKYNLEYPDFYTKLYALLDAKIINGKFGNQFFYLANLFLSSTHLPGSIVAAFAKRLSRISLVSNTASIIKILSLIINLLSSHPSLEGLLHQPDALEYSEDCFDCDATDPAESNAIKSSLWEIKTLRHHVNPEICLKAKILTDSYPKFSVDIPKQSMYDIYCKQRKRKFEDVPLAIQKPFEKKSR